MGANFEQQTVKDTTAGVASQPSRLSDHGFKGLGSYSEAEAQQYMDDYSKLVKQGILPKIDIGTIRPRSTRAWFDPLCLRKFSWFPRVLSNAPEINKLTMISHVVPS
jgi:hypothetical protein